MSKQINEAFWDELQIIHEKRTDILHEIYDVVLQNLKKKLEEKVVGNIFVNKDDHNYYIMIQHPKMGSFRYAIYNVDEIDVNQLSSDKLASMVIRWHKERVYKVIFKARNNP